MQRAHLFEFNDQSWLPDVLRQGITDYLIGISRLAKLHAHMVPHVQRVLEASGADRILDLCSGSGGPILDVREALERPIPVTLTDLFPASLPAVDDPQVTVLREPVDARTCDRPGLRTVCNALHHFEPEDARAILAGAVEADAPIAVFEVTHRDPGAFVALLILPWIVLLVTPFLRPRLTTLLFTYVVPVLPAFIAWDGFVSHLRTYTTDELLGMTEGLGAGWTWRAERHAVGPGTGLTVLLGWPPRG